jgi:hypothetical protein
MLLIENISISLGSNLISSPFLAYSYAFLPSILIDEYIGGVCNCLPTNLLILSLIYISSLFTTDAKTILPVTSYVSVSTPK